MVAVISLAGYARGYDLPSEMQVFIFAISARALLKIY